MSKHDLISLLVLVLLAGFTVVEAGTIAEIVSGHTAAFLSAIAGFILASVLIARAKGAALTPRGMILSGVAAIGLYNLMTALPRQLEFVNLPEYLPAVWIEIICTVGVGLLVGAGVPLLLHALVTVMYSVLE